MVETKLCRIYVHALLRGSFHVKCRIFFAAYIIISRLRTYALIRYNA